MQAVLVLAGPGAGKTFCLIERIRFLVEHFAVKPERICVFTFTNKAAGEIAERLDREIGAHAHRVKRGTIHRFCVELLREFGGRLGIEPGFGIADEEYQLFALRRVEGYRRWHKQTLTRFSAHRFSDEPLPHEDIVLFDKYEKFLAKHCMLDFDTLVLKAADLLEQDAAGEIRKNWDVVLVDEFQDLNRVQYRIIRALASEHQNLFGVGDHEQSIYSWAGADTGVFKSFLRDFQSHTKIKLQENCRCPRDLFQIARQLVALNAPLFEDRVELVSQRDSSYPVATYVFDSDDSEVEWITRDVCRDHAENGHPWGEIALLYRKHEIGDALEGAFLNAGIPCQLAQGRALSEDPVVAYLLSAMRVISRPDDTVHRDQFFASVLPKSLFDEVRAQAEVARQDLRRYLNHLIARRSRADEGARQIRRALRAWKNLGAVACRHTSLESLVQELLSQRVGKRPSLLDECHDQLSDPAEHPEVVRLTERLSHARSTATPVYIERIGGAEIALKGMLESIGIPRVNLGSAPQGVEAFTRDDSGRLGLPLGLFKAAQLLEIGDLEVAFSDFTAIDLETTCDDAENCEIVEIAAVRVRNGKILQEFTSLVRPRVAITRGAVDVHGIREVDVSTAPRFEEVWPLFRAFLADDVIVAHNGYEFDFRVLTRMLRAMGKGFSLCTYDTLPLARDLYPTSRKLPELARKFGIDCGRSHRALDDARTLAGVFVQLNAAKAARARKTALDSALDHLGVALALVDEAFLCEEAKLFRRLCRVAALRRYSSCLEFYEREHGGDLSIPTVDEVIELLGGAKLMVKIRSEKTADDRYPAAMLRLRRLISEIPPGPLDGQVCTFLERAMLSKWDGAEKEGSRINLLTLHSTKGLEFSRVYIVGAEDSELPGGSPLTGPDLGEIEEARRLLYVGMTRTVERLVITCVKTRKGKPTGGHRFLTEMGLVPATPIQAGMLGMTVEPSVVSV